MKSLSKTIVTFGVSALCAIPNPSQAQAVDQAAAIEQLQKELKSLKSELTQLKEGAPRDASADELMGRDFFKSKGLTLGFYGEAKYRFPEGGNNRFDPHRFVLSPSYAINDWLVFNSELELEHGAVDESTNNGRNRFDGELELEQFYVDILIRDWINVRSLGIDLIPVGRVNLYHEPTLFYSTERPELYSEIIPSTWFEPSMGLFGKITETLDYRLQISSGLEDGITTAGSVATATRPAGFAGPGIDGVTGFRGSRPRLRAANENAFAYSGRLHYNGIEGLDASTSVYVTEAKGFSGRSTLALFDIEAIYRVPKTGLELRGDFAYWHVGNPEGLVANNNTSTTDDVGGRMYGYYFEAAYHLWPSAWQEGRGSKMDLVPFIRYTDIVTQDDLPSGSVRNETGTANKDFITAGVSYFLNEHFVIKADYRHNLNGTTASKFSGSSQDYVQLGVGIFF